MARFLALDWDHSQLHVVAATTKHTAVQVQRALVLADDRTPNLATAEALGQKLRDLLKEEKIAPAPVLVSVGRDRVILREVMYPAVPPKEEPAIVRFQAMKELSHAPDEVIIDYAPLPDAGPNGERRAQVLILRRELLQAYEALCKAAGLKLAAITPRPFGTASLLQHLKGTAVPAVDGAAAILTVSDQWAEFCVVRDNTLLLARSLSATAAGAENALLGEIRRNLAVYAGQAPQHPVRALYLAEGGNRAALRQLLQNTLAIPVHGLDPFGGEERPDLPPMPRGSFAGVMGVVHGRADKAGLALNFLEPKEPKQERDPNRLRILVGAAAAALLLAAGVGYGYSQLAALDNKIGVLTREKRDQETLLATLEEEAKKMKAIGDWADTEIVWLDELYDFTERFPNIEAVRLAEWVGDPLTTAPNAKGSGYTAKISLKGMAASSNDNTNTPNALADRLADDRQHYKVGPPNIGPNPNASDRRRFPQQFSAHVEVAPRPPHDYTLHLNAKPPERERQADDNGDVGFFGPGAGMGGVR